MRTLEQVRAADALFRVQQLANKEENFKEKYRSYVDRLGPAIIMNGLGQALATEKASRHDAHDALYAGLSRWLCRSEGGVYSNYDDALEAIVAESQDRYLLAQAEALAWLQWHKKFCRASFPRGEGD